jgi:hypothetical protein
VSIVAGWRNVYEAPGELNALQGQFAAVIETFVIQQDNALRNELRPRIDQNASEIASLRGEVADLHARLDQFESVFSFS